MSEDISKNTLLVLVVLTIVISLLGTWTVITEASRVHSAQANQDDMGQSSTQGKVAISVRQAPQPVMTTGQVILSIVNEDDQ